MIHRLLLLSAALSVLMGGQFSAVTDQTATPQSLASLMPADKTITDSFTFTPQEIKQFEFLQKALRHPRVPGWLMKGLMPMLAGLAGGYIKYSDSTRALRDHADMVQMIRNNNNGSNPPAAALVESLGIFLDARPANGTPEQVAQLAQAHKRELSIALERVLERERHNAKNSNHIAEHETSINKINTQMVGKSLLAAFAFFSAAYFFLSLVRNIVALPSSEDHLFLRALLVKWPTQRSQVPTLFLPLLDACAKRKLSNHEALQVRSFLANKCKLYFTLLEDHKATTALKKTFKQSGALEKEPA